MLKAFHDMELYRGILKKSLLYFSDVPEAELNEFADIFHLRFYPRYTDIITPGNTELKGYFIISGLVRMHYKIRDNEITSDFRDAHSFFLNGYTVYAHQKNFDYFTALEDTVCLVADWDKVELLLNAYHALESMGRKIVEWHYAESMRVSYNMLFMNSEERFKILMNERPGLMNRVPQKYIASYLGVAPETLSRMRSRIK